MDVKSFFIALKDNGNTGGLFVIVILGFFFTVIFWKLAMCLAGILFLLWLAVQGLRRLSFSNLGRFFLYLTIPLGLGLFAWRYLFWNSFHN
jgi:hypothetical protein